MLKRFVFLFILWPAIAIGQTYLVEPTQSECFARSAQQCVAVGCDGVFTKYWWDCQVLAAETTTGGASGTGGTTGIILYAGTPFDATTTVGPTAIPKGLSTAEQAAIQTQTQLGTALPYIISYPSFTARFTQAELDANAAEFRCSIYWNALKGSATTNLNSSQVNQYMDCAVATNIITPERRAIIQAPQPPIANP